MHVSRCWPEVPALHGEVLRLSGAGCRVGV